MEILDGVMCPKCGGKIVITPKAYGCANWRDNDGGCKFTLWKNCCGHDWTEDEARALINGQTVKDVSFISRKTGKPFHADASLDPDTGRVNFAFNNKKNA